jgi:hypothetical protein
MSGFSRWSGGVIQRAYLDLELFDSLKCRLGQRIGCCTSFPCENDKTRLFCLGLLWIPTARDKVVREVNLRHSKVSKFGVHITLKFQSNAIAWEWSIHCHSLAVLSLKITSVYLQILLFFGKLWHRSHQVKMRPALPHKRLRRLESSQSDLAPSHLSSSICHWLQIE